jgi:hypothetical protein
MRNDTQAPKTSSSRQASALSKTPISGKKTESPRPASKPSAKALKRLSRRTPHPSLSTLLRLLTRSQRALTQALTAQQKAAQDFAALARQQSDQIQMVLQQQFYRPILSEADREKQSHEVRQDPQELEDSGHFPAETDKEIIDGEEHDEKQLQALADHFIEELDSITIEHEKAHE